MTNPPWTAAEDAQLVEIKQLGLTWAEISSRIPGRSVAACNSRYFIIRGGADAPRQNKNRKHKTRRETPLDEHEKRILKEADKHKRPNVRKIANALGYNEHRVRVLLAKRYSPASYDDPGLSETPSLGIGKRTVGGKAGAE